jgi:predicted enzyme related to lactoylglutathione lyase
MAHPVVHFEIRAQDPDASRQFFADLFGWTYSPGGIEGYTYVDTGAPGAIPGGIGPTQGGSDLAVFFVGVADVEATINKAVELGGTLIQPAVSVPGVTFGLFADPEGHVVGVAAT